MSISTSTKKITYFSRVVHDIIIEYMTENKGNVFYFSPRKINNFFIRRNKKIFPGHFTIIYKILECIAEKTGGTVFISERSQREKYVIAIPRSIMDMDYDSIIMTCAMKILIERAQEN